LLHLRGHHHEDDQQDQHHVDQRRDVDVRRDSSSPLGLQNAVGRHAYPALGRCRATSPSNARPPCPSTTRAGRMTLTAGAAAMPPTSRSAHVSIRSSSSAAALLSSISSLTTCPFR